VHELRAKQAELHKAQQASEARIAELLHGNNFLESKLEEAKELAKAEHSKHQAELAALESQMKTSEGRYMELEEAKEAIHKQAQQVIHVLTELVAF
jgi:hypothetical protein